MCAVMLSYCCVCRYVKLLLCVPLCYVTLVCVVELLLCELLSYCCVCRYVELLLCAAESLLCVPLC